MQKYQEFIFTDYNFNYSTGELSLRYSFDNKLTFEEKVFFDVSNVNFETIDKELLNDAFLNLHLIAGISYYKAYCPSKLIVKTAFLNDEQIKFWEKIYTLGLGEFFYKNQIDFRGLVNFESVESLESESQDTIPHLAFPKRGGTEKKCLVPIGGGKDSLVTAELLKKGGFDFTLYSLGDSFPQKETAELVGKERLIVNRKLSPNLFELNKEGAYNGHIPISAYIAFLSLATAILYGYDYIVLSNEHSANYGNLDYLGMNINHQYSKSLEFEQDFNNYVEQNICTDIRYFSLLRPYYELKIAKIFSQYSQYFSKFTSCNANFKIIKKVPLEGDTGGFMPQKVKYPPTSFKGGLKEKWCCECPKCAFVYSILSPFIPREKIVKIFGKNLFAEEKLKNLFLELLGVQENKPFECVGTAEEVAVAFYLVSQKAEWQNDFIVKIFIAKVLPQIENIEELKAKVFETYLEDGLIPEEFKNFLK